MFNRSILFYPHNSSINGSFSIAVLDCQIAFFAGWAITYPTSKLLFFSAGPTGEEEQKPAAPSSGDMLASWWKWTHVNPQFLTC